MMLLSICITTHIMLMCILGFHIVVKLHDKHERKKRMYRRKSTIAQKIYELVEMCGGEGLCFNITVQKQTKNMFMPPITDCIISSN